MKMRVDLVQQGRVLAFGRESALLSSRSNEKKMDFLENTYIAPSFFVLGTKCFEKSLKRRRQQVFGPNCSLST